MRKESRTISPHPKHRTYRHRKLHLVLSRHWWCNVLTLVFRLIEDSVRVINWWRQEIRRVLISLFWLIRRLMRRNIGRRLIGWLRGKLIEGWSGRTSLLEITQQQQKITMKTQNYILKSLKINLDWIIRTLIKYLGMLHLKISSLMKLFQIQQRMTLSTQWGQSSQLNDYKQNVNSLSKRIKQWFLYLVVDRKFHYSWQREIIIHWGNQLQWLQGRQTS